MGCVGWLVAHSQILAEACWGQRQGAEDFLPVLTLLFLQLWRTFLCFPLGLGVLARHQLLAEKCHVCSQMALIQNSEVLWKCPNVNKRLLWNLRVAWVYLFLLFLRLNLCFPLLSTGNNFDREKPNVWVVEEPTSTCLYGVLLLQCDQSRGVLGRREGSC